MENIYESASKIVFIMLSLTVCISFLLGVLPSDQFMILASAAFAFYFSNKGNTDEKFLGK